MLCYCVLKATLLPPTVPRSRKLQRIGVWFCRDKEIKRSWASLGEVMAALLKMVWLRKRNQRREGIIVEACLWYWRVFKSVIRTLRNSITLSHLPLLPPNLILTQNTWKDLIWQIGMRLLGCSEQNVLWSEISMATAMELWAGMGIVCHRNVLNACVSDPVWEILIYLATSLLKNQFPKY